MHPRWYSRLMSGCHQQYYYPWRQFLFKCQSVHVFFLIAASPRVGFHSEELVNRNINLSLSKTPLFRAWDLGFRVEGTFILERNTSESMYHLLAENTQNRQQKTGNQMLNLAVYPMIYRLFYLHIPGGLWCKFHQQYRMGPPKRG